MLIGVILYGLGIFCVSQANNLAMFYSGFLIIGLGNSLTIHMVPRTTVARWFNRDMGKANGMIAVGLGAGGALLPLLVIMIDAYGWQTSLFILAAGMWILGIPLSLIYRTRPEDYGLLPDGRPQDDVQTPGISKSYDFSTTVKEALKMRAFWHMGLAFMLQAVAIFAVTTHVMPYLASLGVARSTASLVVMFIPLASLPARLGFGWLADIFVKKYVAATACLLISAGSILFWLIDGSSFGLMVAFVIIFGLGLGGITPLRPPLIREYFGTKRFGTILGLTGAFSMIGLVAGPPVAGWVYDNLGVYDPIWLILSGVAQVGAILMLSTPPASLKQKSIS